MIEYVKKYGSRNYKIQDFESMNEIANYIQNTPDIDKYALTNKDYLRSESAFLGIDSFDKVLDRLRYGDDKMTTMFLNQLATLKTEEGETKDAFFMDTEGVAYDMGSVVAGEPECCINQGYPESKPYIKIFIDIGYCGGVSPKTISYRGVAVYQLITNLISRGYIVDVYFIHFIDASDGGYYAQTVKLSTDYLVTSQIAFGGTCEFFRIVTWLLTAIQKNSKHYTGNGCSMPSSEVIKSLKKDGLFIPSGYTDGRFNGCNQDEAIKYVTEIYNEYVEAKCK
jgi:hypothetical protein